MARTEAKTGTSLLGSSEQQEREKLPILPEEGGLLTNPRQRIVIAVSSTGAWYDWMLAPKGILNRDIEYVKQEFSDRVDKHLEENKGAIVRFVHGSTYDDATAMASAMGIKIPKLVERQLQFVLQNMRTEKSEVKKPKKVFRPQLSLVDNKSGEVIFEFPKYSRNQAK